MATVLSFPGANIPAAEFVEALHALGQGAVSLEFARQRLTHALKSDPGQAAQLQSLLDTASRQGQLRAAHHAALARELEQHLDEDPPTEPAGEGIEECGKASDTRPSQPTGTDPDAANGHAAPLYPGAVLRQRFVLQARVTTSSMSEVFKALDRRRQESGAPRPWVAIKLVAPGVRDRTAAMNLLQKEAALAQQLRHPNIVQVLDFDRDDEHGFLTMEWLDGESLADLLTRRRSQPLALQQARAILARAGDALEFAHSRGITHADVKPGNIFITSDGHTKLLDFGVARQAGAAGSEARTPAYASCEVLEGAAPTPQDDVYALACVAYRMLAGRRVFGHLDAIAAEKSARQPAPIRNLASAQWAALARALALRRTQRTPDMASFMRDFLAAAPAAYAPAKAPVPRRPVAPPPRRRAVVKGAAAPGSPAPARPAAANKPGPAATGTARRRLLPGAAAAAVALMAWWSMRPDSPPPTPEVAPAPRAIGATQRPAPPARPPAQASAPPPSRSSAQRPPAPPAAAPTPREPPRRPLRQPPAPKPDAAPAPADAAALTRVTEPAPATTEVATAPAATPDVAPGSVAGPADAPASPVADTAPPGTPAAPREVALTELTFARYVEPKDRRRTLSSRPGWVQLSFTVAADGTPRDIRIVESSPSGRYDSAALSAVKRWRFVPVIEDGQPVERRTAVRLRFQPE